MTGSTDRFDSAIAAIDEANSSDPNSLTVAGRKRPKELAHAEMVTAWVKRLASEPSEELKLAARGHHLRRWTSPRTDYPAGRAGYLRWRRDLHERHAAELGQILETAGYDHATVSRVAQIVRKRGLRTDPEVQTFEDALCLVFLETQLTEVAHRIDEDKLVDVLAKTSAKMSEAGLKAAAGLSLSAEGHRLLGLGLQRAELAPDRSKDNDS